VFTAPWYSRSRLGWHRRGRKGTLAQMAPPSLWLYRALMAVALPLLAPSLLIADRRRGKKRPPWAQRLGWRLPAIPPGGVWVQAVSVGEVAVARPLLAELRRRHPVYRWSSPRPPPPGWRWQRGHSSPT
jgi:hypothetical protein